MARTIPFFKSQYRLEFLPVFRRFVFLHDISPLVVPLINRFRPAGPLSSLGIDRYMIPRLRFTIVARTLAP
jgi:hypothetical protein